MENKILSAEGFLNWECECGEELGRDENNMIEACNEPFNGIIITCPKCQKEYDIMVGFRVEELD